MPKRRREKRSKSVRRKRVRSSQGRQSQSVRIQIQSAPGAAGGGGGGGAGSAGGAPPVQYMPQAFYPQMRGREQGRRDVVSGGRQAARPPVRMDVPMAPPPVAAAPLSENAVPADVLQAPNVMQSDPVYPGEPKAMERPSRRKMGKIKLSRGVQPPARQPEVAMAVPPVAEPVAPNLPLVLRDSAPRQTGEVALRENIPQSGIVPGSIWARFSREEFERRFERARRWTENRRRGAYLPPASASPVVEEPPSPAVVPIPRAMRAAIIQPASFRVPPLSGETAATIRAAVAEQSRLEAIKEEMEIPPEAPVASVTSQQLVIAPHATQAIEPAVISGGARAKRHEQYRLESRRERFEQKREARKAAERVGEAPASTIIAGGPTFQFSRAGEVKQEPVAAPVAAPVAPLVPEAAASMGIGQQPAPLRSIPFLEQPLVWEPLKEEVTTKRPDRGGDYDYQGPRPASVAFPKAEREAVEAIPKVFRKGQAAPEPGAIPFVGPAAGYQGTRVVFDDE